MRLNVYIYTVTTHQDLKLLQFVKSIQMDWRYRTKKSWYQALETGRGSGREPNRDRSRSPEFPSRIAKLLLGIFDSTAGPM